MKTIYHVSTEIFGEYDYFFDQSGKLLHYWHKNDAIYSNEYMSPLLEKLGVIVEDIHWQNKLVKEHIIKISKADGASDNDIKEAEKYG